jgi:hypothetical protein
LAKHNRFQITIKRFERIAVIAGNILGRDTRNFSDNIFNLFVAYDFLLL